MDPYRVLGVATHASQREIKRAYRRLAFRYHPDRNPDDPESEERFKELVTAYQILSNRAKRADYDREQAARATPGRAETSWDPPPRPPPREDWQEVFSTLRREPMRSATPFDFDDAYLGALFSVSFTIGSNVSDSSAATFALAILAGAAVSWPFKFLSQWIAGIGLPVVRWPSRLFVLGATWLGGIAPSTFFEATPFDGAPYAFLGGVLGAVLGAAVGRVFTAVTGPASGLFAGALGGALFGTTLGAFAWFWGSVFRYLEWPARDDKSVLASVGILAACLAASLAGALGALREPST